MDDAARIARKFVALVTREFERSGTIVEKYDVVRGASDVAGDIRFGYHENQVGFGWTNGVYLELLARLGASPEDARALAAGPERRLAHGRMLRCADVRRARDAGPAPGAPPRHGLGRKPDPRCPKAARGRPRSREGGRPGGGGRVLPRGAAPRAALRRGARPPRLRARAAGPDRGRARRVPPRDRSGPEAVRRSVPPGRDALVDGRPRRRGRSARGRGCGSGRRMPARATTSAWRCARPASSRTPWPSCARRSPRLRGSPRPTCSSAWRSRTGATARVRSRSCGGRSSSTPGDVDARNALGARPDAEAGRPSDAVATAARARLQQHPERSELAQNLGARAHAEG